MPNPKKLPKWAIKQAGGINKKAWALARRGHGGRKARKATKKARKAPRRQNTPRSVSGASHNNKRGFGSWFKMGRTIDVFSGPAQGSLGRRGFTKEAGIEAANLYTGGQSSTEFEPLAHPETLQPTIGGIGTGLIRDWLRSKLGIYRGLGQKKILSGVMAANPEIMATAEQMPQDDVARWNSIRTAYDRGYDAGNHLWDVMPGSGTGDRFLKSLGLDVGLKVTQKVAEHFINPMLPPGYNL